MTESTRYHPDLRSVPCRVLTVAGFLRGSLHVPRKAHLLEFLNRDEPVYRLTDVALPGQTGTRNFFALVRSAVLAVLPDAEDPEPGGPGSTRLVTVPHRVLWLLQSGGLIEGELPLLPNVRISDHLAHRAGFIALQSATLFLPDGAGNMVAEPGIEALALQTSNAIGVTEIA